jgi:hypothetical protein
MLIALALEKPADLRPALLDVVCAGDPALRQRLETLLAAHQKADELPPSDAPAVKATIKLELFWPESGAENILALRRIHSTHRLDQFWKYRLNQHAAPIDALALIAR